MALPDFRALIDEATERQPPPAPEEPADERILDGALQVVAEYGERRLTMDDVAAAAKVARATVFRRFGSKDALLARLYAREVRRAMAYAFAAVPDDSDAAEVLAAVAGALADYTTGHPVIQRVARAEPDVLVELWRSGEPAGIDLIREFLAGVVADRDPSIGSEQLRADCDSMARRLFADMLLGPPRGRASRRRTALRAPGRTVGSRPPRVRRRVGDDAA